MKLVSFKAPIGCYCITLVAAGRRLLWDRARRGAPAGKTALRAEKQIPQTIANTEEIAFIYAGFRHFTKTQNSVGFAFDHSLSHFYAKNEKIE
ncbi:MAG: hypothetical protein E7591_05620 [Ruminococcaceae bacterium]|nr:hypothetical protein [Oscillospiraceae bacterium]